MALNRLPLSDSYELVCAYDSALDADREDFADAYRIASERLEWSPLYKSGERPTMFVCRPLGALVLRFWRDAPGFHQDMEIPAEGDAPARTVSVPTQIGLTFLLLMSVHEVKNWPEFPEAKRRVQDDYRKLGPMFDPILIAGLDAGDVEAGRPIGSSVSELGQLCWQRNMLRPLASKG